MKKAKIRPYIQAPVAHGNAIASLPSQIAYGEGLKKRHVVKLWRHNDGYLTLSNTSKSNYRQNTQDRVQKWIKRKQGNGTWEGVWS